MVVLGGAIGAGGAVAGCPVESVAPLAGFFTPAGADAVLPPGVTGTACRFSKSLFVAGAADVVVPVLDVPSVLGGMT